MVLIELFLTFIVNVGTDENIAINNLHSKNGDIIGPQVEATTALYIKPSMVPITSQYPILIASSTEGESHMRTTIV
jgi:hypothetical protein